MNKSLLNIKWVKNISDLPSNKGKVVAFQQGEDGIHICIEDAFRNSDYLKKLNQAIHSTLKKKRDKPKIKEYIYTGSLEALANYLNAATLIVTHSLKDFLWKNQIFFQNFTQYNRTLDLAIAAWILDSESKKYDYSSLHKKYIPALPNNETAYSFLRISEKLLEKIESRKQTYVLFQMEMPLVKVLFQMEFVGMQIDRNYLEHFLNVECESKKNLILQNSEKLLDTYSLPIDLEKVALSEKDLNQHNNIISSIKSLFKFTDDNNIIHANINQTATSTGRLSISRPALQAIHNRDEFAAKIRYGFIAKQGKIFVGADYSQIEIRVLAHFTKDPALMEAFKNGEDVYKSVASLIYGLIYQEVTKEMRKNAKTVSLGLLYGMGIETLAEKLQVSQTEARQLKSKYFEMFSSIPSFVKNLTEYAKANNNTVATLAGRYRTLKDKAYPNFLNTQVQGTAADIAKQAMLDVASNLQMKKWNAHLVLQVHDELILEVDEEYAEEARKLLVHIMENVQIKGESLSVPLAVTSNYAKTWYGLK